MLIRGKEVKKVEKDYLLMKYNPNVFQLAVSVMVLTIGSKVLLEEKSYHLMKL
jgi:hypothetical protein